MDVDLRLGHQQRCASSRPPARRQTSNSRASNSAGHEQHRDPFWGSALAAFCYLGDAEKRDQAAANLNRLADYLVLPDGSDREGSPWYAYHTLRLLTKLAPVYARCGEPYDQIAAAIKRQEHFLAAAVDPNFYLVMKATRIADGCRRSGSRRTPR